MKRIKIGKKREPEPVKKSKRINNRPIFFPGSSSGYAQSGASTQKNSLKGFKARSYGPESDIDQNNQTLRERGRAMYMGNPIAASAIKTLRTNVVGCGLLLKPRINAEILGMSTEEAEEWQIRTEHEFMLWAESKQGCDALGINDFYGIQQLAFSSWLMSGDTFSLIKYEEPTWLRPYSLRLQMIEADRIATPMEGATRLSTGYTTGQNHENGNIIYDGVEVDDNGKIVAYHICNAYPYDYSRLPIKWTRIEAFGRETGLPNILHLMVSERPDQYRGVTLIAQIIEPLLQLNRYKEAELANAIVESYLTGYVTVDSPSENPFNEVAGHYDLEEYERNPDEYTMGPGNINFLNPGESITFNNPAHPASGFGTFVRAIAEEVGAAIEVPADLLLKSFNSSYSASRGAILEAWKAFRMYREWFISDFCRPVYELWMCEAVARGRIEAPGFFEDPAIRAAWLGADWIGPSQGQLDPTKEIQAEIMAIKEGLASRTDAAIRLNGSEFERNVRELARENQSLADVNEPLQQLLAIGKKGEEGLEKDAADAEKKGAEADATGSTEQKPSISDQSTG